MEYVAYVLAVFGLMAYMQVYSLKNRVSKLEEALTGLKGTRFHEDRSSLLKAASSYIGKKVKIELKEDHQDADVVMYGNTVHGSNTITDLDRDWLLLDIQTPKGRKEKLIRMESVQRISLIDE
ncbi:MAG: hypothetical protein IKE38_05670 [Erysipelotrichaceae bacterium]|nr:hypothetical protein [Erysipelotrichaceae bacterium]